MLGGSFKIASNLLELMISRALASVVAVVLYNRAHLHQVATYTVCTCIVAFDVTMLLTVSNPTVHPRHHVCVQRLAIYMLRLVLTGGVAYAASVSHLAVLL